jgi:hypothetical protein
MTIAYPKPAVRGAWADLAPVWNGSTGDIDDPGNTFVEAGWTQSTTPPPYQYFNWALNWASQGVRYFMQRGIVDWDAAELYQQGAIVQYYAGPGVYADAWVSVTNNNTGVAPGTNSAYWQTAFTTPAALTAALTSYLTTASALGYFAPIDNPNLQGAVQVPNLVQGTNNTQAANTAFVQAAILAALVNYVSNSSLATTLANYALRSAFTGNTNAGAQTLWDKCSITGIVRQSGVSSNLSVTFPQEFPNEVVSIGLTQIVPGGIGSAPNGIQTYNNNGFTVVSNTLGYFWHAEGF